MAEPKKKVAYINNKDFYAAIVEYRKKADAAKKKNKPKPQIPNYIGECILKIAKNLANRPNFSGYTWKDEFIDDAIENCITAFDNFDPKRFKNPFGYFTQICWYAFVRRIHLEKKQQYIKYKITEQSGIVAEIADSAEDGHVIPVELYDNISTFIGEFEEKNNIKPKKAKTVKQKKGKIEEFLES